jgi:uncharacterized protein
MKKVTFILFFCLGIVTCSFGQTKRDSIKELFHLMKDDSTTKKVTDSLMPLLTKKMGMEKDSTAKAKSQEKMKAMLEMVKTIISKVKEDRLNLYDKYYTQQDIDAMIVFYKSPAGRKYVRTTPEITKEIVMKVITEYLPQMEKDKKDKKDGKKEEETN